MTFDAAKAAATVDALDAALRRLASAQRAAQEKRYLKSDLVHLGVTVPDVRKTVKAAYAALKPGLQHDELIVLADRLWASDVYERRLAAVELLKAGHASLTPDDLPRIEGMIREGSMWSLVDPLSGDLAGPLVLRYPACAATIDRWSADPDFWIRRSAQLTLLPGIRAGDPDLDRFTAYTDAMLDDTQFFIRKAIGWVARELSKSRPSFVVSWAESRLHRMSGITFREVVRRLSDADAARLTRS